MEFFLVKHETEQMTIHSTTDHWLTVVCTVKHHNIVTYAVFTYTLDTWLTFYVQWHTQMIYAWEGVVTIDLDNDLIYICHHVII